MNPYGLSFLPTSVREKTLTHLTSFSEFRHIFCLLCTNIPDHHDDLYSFSLRKIKVKNFSFVSINPNIMNSDPLTDFLSLSSYNNHFIEQDSKWIILTLIVRFNCESDWWPYIFVNNWLRLLIFKQVIKTWLRNASISLTLFAEFTYSTRFPLSRRVNSMSNLFFFKINDLKSLYNEKNTL